jgi:hypothetical protein
MQDGVWSMLSRVAYAAEQFTLAEAKKRSAGDLHRFRTGRHSQFSSYASQLNLLQTAKNNIIKEDVVPAILMAASCWCSSMLRASVSMSGIAKCIQT